jgi:hypothetical protein
MKKIIPTIPNQFNIKQNIIKSSYNDKKYKHSINSKKNNHSRKNNTLKNQHNKENQSNFNIEILETNQYHNKNEKNNLKLSSTLVISILLLQLIPGIASEHICSIYKNDRYMYNNVAGPQFGKRNFWCRTGIGVREECWGWVAGNVPKREIDAMKRYYEIKDKGEDGYKGDYSDLLKELNPSIYQHYCSNKKEIQVESKNFVICPSILRSQFPNGIKNCPKSNLELNDGIDNQEPKPFKYGKRR